MNLFGRRPLCLFCAFFLLSSLFFFAVDAKLDLIVMVSSLSLAVLAVLFVAVLRKYRIQCLTVFLCLLSVCLSFVNSYFRIDAPILKAQAYQGVHSVEMTVLEACELKDSSATFVVETSKIDQEKAKQRFLLYCRFVPVLRVGDQVHANVELKPMSERVDGIKGEDRTRDEKVSMVAVLSEASGAKVRAYDENSSILSTLARPCGLRLAIHQIKLKFSAYVEQLFDEETAALVNGFFVGDTSGLSAFTLRDFRRTGLSHLLAVSGLHFSILLGVLDWLLRMLRLPKGARCAVSAVVAVAFLALTGFSLSACRSALMLMMVYVHYLLSEDHDTPTALFVSLVTILLLSPHAVEDLGLWMSFLATLGLVTVFPWIDSKIPFWKPRKKPLRWLLRIARLALTGIAITVIANFFLLPISWYYFGEASAVTVLVNLLVSPLSFWILPLMLMALCFGAVPVLGGILIGSVALVFTVMMAVVRFFSRMNIATFSLNTPWADLLIPLFACAMVLVLILPLKKRKWLSLVPAVSVTFGLLLFGVLHSVFGAPQITYVQSDTMDAFILQEKGKTVVCDISGGIWYESYEVVKSAKELSAVRIDTLILTHIHSMHDQMLKMMNEQILVNQIMLPIPKNKEEYALAREVTDVALHYGVEVSLYELEKSRQVTDSIWMKVQEEETEIKEETAVTVQFATAQKRLTYLSPSASDIENAQIAQSDVVVFGTHGRECRAEPLKILTQTRTDALWIVPRKWKKWKGHVQFQGTVMAFREDFEPQRITVDLS